MKKILFAAISLVMILLTTSCSNDEIIVEKDTKVNDVNVTVSLSNFFSSYNFYDTQHDINVNDNFRTFNSEGGIYIQVRTLFYDNNGVLVDSLLSYSTNTNSVSASKKLAEGNYTVISTLTFASKNSGDDASFWLLSNKEKLSTASLLVPNRFTEYSIMSYDAKTITVRSGQSTSVSMAPAPVGALGYMFCQNFQYKNAATYGTAADNGVRKIAVYSQNIAISYKLDPNSREKYEYMDDAGQDNWYYLEVFTPQDFDDSWTCFKSNLYSFFYILAPNPNLQFGYMLEGASGFAGTGGQRYNIENGNTYLAYWDWFQVGNPYFGIADNNHWHSYSNSKVYSLSPKKNFDLKSLFKQNSQKEQIHVPYLAK